MFDLNSDKETPRERHYVLGHIALRQVCEQDPHYFFGVLASDDQTKFLANLISQVEENCPDDPSQIDATQIEVVPSRLGNKPVTLIKMPPAAAYAECIYIGVVSMMDMNKPEDYPDPEIQYFTLELGEGDEGLCSFFCQWDGEDHLNLAELESNISLDDFATIIGHRVEGQQS